MKNNKFLKFLFRYKIAIIIAIVLSIISYFNPVEYSDKYDMATNEINTLANKIDELQSKHEIDDISSEITKLEEVNDNLNNGIDEKSAELEKLSEEREAKLKAENEAKLKEEQEAKLKAEEAKIKANEEAKVKEEEEAKAKEKAKAEEKNKSEQQVEENRQSKSNNSYNANNYRYNNKQNNVNHNNYQSTTVYITPTGQKYHRIPKCGNTKSSTPISVEEAQQRGYNPCKKCF